MRDAFTRERLHPLMKELAQAAPRGGPWRIFLVGGGTAVSLGWRSSSMDVDLFSDRDEVFRDIQEIKERLNLNVEFARPEHFVPPLPGSEERHLFIETIGRVSFYHYDPYAQILSKIVRGFRRDVDDARQFVGSGLVDPDRLRKLVGSIPDRAYAGYPQLSRQAVERAVGDFLATLT